MDDGHSEHSSVESTEFRPNKRKPRNTTQDSSAESISSRRMQTESARQDGATAEIGEGAGSSSNIRFESTGDPRMFPMSATSNQQLAVPVPLEHQSNLLARLQNVQAAHAQTQWLQQQLQIQAQQEHLALAARSQAHQMSSFMSLQHMLGSPMFETIVSGQPFVPQQPAISPHYSTFVTQPPQTVPSSQEQHQNRQAQLQLQLQMLQRHQPPGTQLRDDHTVIQMPPSQTYPVRSLPSSAGTDIALQFGAPTPAATYLVGPRLDTSMPGLSPSFPTPDPPTYNVANIAQALRSGSNGPSFTMTSTSAGSVGPSVFAGHVNQGRMGLPGTGMWPEAAGHHAAVGRGMTPPRLWTQYMQQQPSERDISAQLAWHRDGSGMQATPILQPQAVGVGDEDAVAAGGGQLGAERDVRQRHSKYCHFCQHIKASMLACGNPQCTFRFCRHCVSTHLEESWDHAARRLADGGPGAWLCPCCRRQCCCCTISACTKDHPHCKAYRKRTQDRSVPSLPTQSAQP